MASVLTRGSSLGLHFNINQENLDYTKCNDVINFQNKTQRSRQFKEYPKETTKSKKTVCKPFKIGSGWDLV